MVHTGRFGEVCHDAHRDTQEPEHRPQCLDLGVIWAYLLKDSVTEAELMLSGTCHCGNSRLGVHCLSSEGYSAVMKRHGQGQVGAERDYDMKV